jgi:hypothetical protein
MGWFKARSKSSNEKQLGKDPVIAAFGGAIFFRRRE